MAALEARASGGGRSPSTRSHRSFTGRSKRGDGTWSRHSASSVRAEIHEAIASAIRDGIHRALAIAGLGGVALIHVLDAPGTFQEQPYKGVLYVALIAGCLAASAALLAGSDRRAWIAATLLPAGAVAAFVVSRTIGLPGGADDIGNWTEPLGIASLFVEGSLVALGAGVLRTRTAGAGTAAGAGVLRELVAR